MGSGESSLYMELMFRLSLHMRLHLLLESSSFQFLDVSGSVVPGNNTSVESLSGLFL